MLLDGGQEIGVEARVEANVVLDLDGVGVQVDEFGVAVVVIGGFLSLNKRVAYRLHHDVAYKQHI